ncbi:hypothetical protein [Epilithonimonas caeni]|uniref:hypothetical protein n=1 Tax=Epilithonimonas caeni TaxID=365343 RepID=UPI00041FCA89|nr:hypothetical protein [Epilithonimonas caeni]
MRIKFTFFLILVLLNSCSSNSDDTTETQNSNGIMPTEVINGFGKDLYYYNGDKLNKIISGGTTTTFTYSGDKITNINNSIDNYDFSYNGSKLIKVNYTNISTLKTGVEIFTWIDDYNCNYDVKYPSSIENGKIKLDSNFNLEKISVNKDAINYHTETRYTYTNNNSPFINIKGLRYLHGFFLVGYLFGYNNNLAFSSKIPQEKKFYNLDNLSNPLDITKYNAEYISNGMPSQIESRGTDPFNYTLQKFTY